MKGGVAAPRGILSLIVEATGLAGVELLIVVQMCLIYGSWLAKLI